MRSQGELRAFLVYVLYRGATTAELDEIKKGSRNVVRFGRSGALEVPAMFLEKTYDHNAVRPYDKPEKILKSPELKNTNTYTKKYDLAGS